ncbi:hypothetical protein [Pseudoalteromonas sp. SG43-5]|uniref:hypothetical protein n=1 Tax=Pseudoalteromonas sp. SG43-5 TaxID=2760968 RepID=UPI0016045CD6|nr:hypothetical protein [Pseudoalteromonas sp. SG43-5]MBB1456683.1 hypothetical protein [Pseudoalteromonas sp. SG43-5]
MLKYYRIDTKMLLRLPYFIVILFFVFDGVRDNVSFSSQLTVLRELAILLISFVTAYSIFSGGLKVKAYFKSYLFISFTLFLSMFISYYATMFPVFEGLRTVSTPFSIITKQIQFFLLIVAFYKYESVTGGEIERLVLFFIYTACLYALITPLIYFYPPPFFEDYKSWGRFGVGYPTMDAQMFLFAFVFSAFYCNFSKAKFFLIASVLVVGTLLQVTGTGFATIAALVLSLIIFPSKQPRSLMITLIFLATLFVFSLYFSYADKFENVVYLFQSKALQIFGAEESISLDIRQEQFEQLMVLAKNDFVTNLFGIGGSIYVENQFSFFRLSSGVIGFSLFIIWMFLFGSRSFSKFQLDNGVLFFSLMTFVLSSYSLVSFYLLPLYGLLALATALHLIKVKHYYEKN